MLTRFHLTAIMAFCLAVSALLFGKWILLLIISMIFLVSVGLGVMSPRLRLFGDFVCRGDPTRRCVALTFDDGPDANSTPVLLDMLRDAQIAATFFCIGKNIAAHPELAARILREGHLIENHTYHHRYITNFFTLTRLQAELADTQAIIHSTIGVKPQYFRPPMGLSNPRIFRAARRLGLRVIGWTARGFDTQCKQPQRIVQRIMQKLKPGAIILLHDGKVPAERLTATLQLLLLKLREQNYEIVRLDKLFKEDSL